MNLDDEICYCYHVSMRKLINYSRRLRPDRPSRMTGCLNAGTGCGWCIPFLTKIAQNPEAFALDAVSPEDYAEQRGRYRADASARNTFEE
ncbi:MAG: (2Fe-2S)-binding protein [Planctomycetes bacterium]|nr:(2Fe-2S)-binding protein [Planctomycetota bacterium]